LGGGGGVRAAATDGPATGGGAPAGAAVAVPGAAGAKGAPVWAAAETTTAVLTRAADKAVLVQRLRRSRMIG
jgi:hypothetical protein